MFLSTWLLAYPEFKQSIPYNKKNRWQLLQIKMYTMHYTIWAMTIFE